MAGLAAFREEAVHEGEQLVRVRLVHGRQSACGLLVGQERWQEDLRRGRYVGDENKEGGALLSTKLVAAPCWAMKEE